MIKVNLAGSKKRVNKAAAKSTSPTNIMPLILLLIIVGTAAGGYYWYSNLVTAVADVTQRVTEADLKVKELDQIIKMDQVYEARKAALEDRIKIIDGLKGNQVSPVVSLDMLGNAIDRTQFVWLSSLDQNNTTFTMAGTGTSVEALADFVTNLENTGYFRNIDLKRFEDSRGNFTFNMTCEFSPPGDPETCEHPSSCERRQLMATATGGLSKMKWYYQILVVAGVCAGLLAVSWYFYLSPMTLEVEAKTKQLGDLNTRIEKSLQQKAGLEKFKKESLALEARLEQLKSVLPQDKETDQVLRQVKTAAELSGLRIQRYTARAPIDHEVYTEVPQDMEVVGTYHAIGAFLDRIRQLPRIVNIANLRIQSRASEGELAHNASVGATFTATTFVYREEIVQQAPPAKPAKVK